MSLCPKSVLAAVDFGDASGVAVALAGAIADCCGSGSFTVLHAEAMEAPAYFTHEQIAALERQRRQLRHDAEVALSRFARRHTSTPFSVVVEYRNAVDAILAAAVSADLVVMGTHGHRGAQRWWLGSVAERVVRSITQPIVIARAEAPLPIESAFSRIVAHADAPLDGADTLRYASDLAACFGTTAIDARQQPIGEMLGSDGATLVAVAAPVPRSSEWLSRCGEPLIRTSTIPVLMVPELKGKRR